MDQDNNLNEIMRDYLINESKSREEIQKKEKQMIDELKINFNFTSSDGRDVNFICNGDSKIFDINGEVVEDNDDITKDEEEEYNICKCNIGMEANLEEDREIDECIYEETEDDNDYLDQDENNYEDRETKCKDELSSDISGNIKVIVSLDIIGGTKIKGVRINLYRINGISPELVEWGTTDCYGEIEFCNIPKGDYRIIEIIDKKYFNKPVYINWNEVKIDRFKRNHEIYVVNSINNSCRNK